LPFGGLNPGGGKVFSTCPDQSWVPTSLLYSEYCVIPRGKAALTTHPNLAPRLKKD